MEISRPRVKLPGGNSKIYIPGLNGGFNPATLTGLIGRWEGAIPDSFYQDSDLTIPAGIGDALGGVRDSRTGGTNTLAPTSSATVVAGPNEFPAISGDGMGRDSMRPTGNVPYSFAAIMPADTGAGCLFGDSATYDGIFYYSATPTGFRNTFTNTVPTVIVSLGSSSEWMLVIGVWGRGDRTVGLYYDGEAIGGGGFAASVQNADLDPTNPDLRINTSGGGGTGKPVAAAWFANACWTPAEIAGLVQYAKAVYGTRTYAPPPQIQCAGNSIVFGTTLSDPATQSWPAKLQVLIGGAGSYHVANLGIGSQTTDMMLTHTAGLTYPFGASSRPHIYFGLEGTNQLFVGSSAVVTLAKLTDLYDGVRDSGFAAKRVVVCTILPFGSSFEADRIAVNTGLRALCAASGYTLCDFAADPLMGQAGQNVEPLFNDGLHPSDDGTTRLSAIAYAAWQAATA